jgi:hypothetical protein
VMANDRFDFLHGLNLGLSRRLFRRESFLCCWMGNFTSRYQDRRRTGG